MDSDSSALSAAAADVVGGVERLLKFYRGLDDAHRAAADAVAVAVGNCGGAVLEISAKKGGA